MFPDACIIKAKCFPFFSEAPSIPNADCPVRVA